MGDKTHLVNNGWTTFYLQLWDMALIVGDVAVIVDIVEEVETIACVEVDQVSPVHVQVGVYDESIFIMIIHHSFLSKISEMPIYQFEIIFLRYIVHPYVQVVRLLLEVDRFSASQRFDKHWENEVAQRFGHSLI